MKKVILSISAMLVASISFAQANVSAVNQIGIANAAIITQTGLANDSDVLQLGFANLAVVDQDGRRNEADINQVEL